MSVSSTVFLAARHMPDARAWAAAIRKEGFALELPVNIDLRTHSDWLPCRYAGEPSGFELIVQQPDAYLTEQEVATDDVRRAACGADSLAITFVTKSAMRDLVSAEIAAAVLATLARGAVWSDEAGALFTAAEAMEVARARAGIVLVPEDAATDKPPEARSIAVTLPVRVVFKGEHTLLLASLEDKPRRFTVRVTADPAGKELAIVALWEHAVGAATVHELRVGDEIFELDPKGEPMGTL
jgi:hypothetical protein